MAAQAALIADTIAGMKRAIAGCPDFSDSDDPYLQATNRGNKLKRKAYLMQEGRSDRANGLKPFRRSIEHATYRRNILRRNPKRYDEDGDELADSDLDEEADARAAEENPYAEVRLENLLLPLVSAASLPDHPSLSVAYTSPILTNMTQHAGEMVQRERKTLANAKRLITKLRGDATWLPCELFDSWKDDAVFDTKGIYDNLAPKRPSQRVNGFTAQYVGDGKAKRDSISGSRKSSASEIETGPVNGAINSLPGDPAIASNVKAEEVASYGNSPPLEAIDDRLKEIESGLTHDGHVAAIGHHGIVGDMGSGMVAEDSDMTDKTLEGEAMDAAGQDTSGSVGLHSADAMQNRGGNCHNNDEFPGDAKSPHLSQEYKDNDVGLEPDLDLENAPEDFPTSHANETKAEAGEGDEGGGGTEQPPPRRMRTRAQAQAASEPTILYRSESPESCIPVKIHHLFKIPRPAVPDKDFGLPANEAEETRRLLLMYVQKQEEVCRGVQKLYDGFLSADRQRKTVLKWCKAEGHVGEMSDGEDWYDKEEWGLEDDLEKGLNDEDGDNIATLGKKTRGRRA